MTKSTRRQILAATAATALTTPALSRTISSRVPFEPDAVPVPVAAGQGPLQFLTAAEAATIDAIADCLIPADDLGPGGAAAGCTIFIDRQLAGSYGANEGLYTQGPFPEKALPSQGQQSPLTPRDHYRQGLAALSQYCVAQFAGRRFEELGAAEKDALLKGLEKGDIKLSKFDGKILFNAILRNTMEGFFADPVYGGNRDMAGWKLVGFPGTRYDYRDVIDNPNQPYSLPPVSIKGRADWDETAK